jgi:Sec-independent protein translocase protein TatA
MIPVLFETKKLSESARKMLSVMARLKKTAQCNKIEVSNVPPMIV